MTGIDVELERGHLDTAGERIYWERATPATGNSQTVVLTHGAGGSHASWYQQVPVLCDSGYRVVTWDQRAFGRTTNATKDAGPVTAARDLAALLAGPASGQGPVHLVGQSMGGWAVLAHTLAAPETVRSLVMADTIGGIFTPVAAAANDAFTARAAASFTGRVTLGSHAAVGPALDRVRSFLYQQLGSFADPPMAKIGGLLRSTEVDLDRVRAIDRPVLFVVGSDDEIFPPHAIRDVASLISGARVAEIPGAGHSPYFETPDAWNDAVLAFLSAT